MCVSLYVIFLGELQSRGTKIHVLVLCTPTSILVSMVSFAEVTLSYPSVSKTSLGCPWLSKPN